MGSQLKAGAVLSYIALFLNSAISIVYTPIMLKLLGQSEYGLYSLANSAAGFIGILNFGLGNAVIRYTAKYKALNDEVSCSKIYGMFFKMYSILGGVALIGGLVLTVNTHWIFSNSLTAHELYKLKILMIIITINISIGIGLGLFSVVILAHEKFVFQKIIVIISSIINPLIMLPLLLMGFRSITMAIVSTIITVLSTLLYIFYCYKVLKIKILFKKIDNKILKEILIFSSYIFINLVIGKIYDSTDQIILGIYSGTVAISLYSIAVTFSGYFSGFSSAISNVFLSKVTGLVAKEVPEGELSNLFIRIGRIQYIVISFALSGFIVFGQEFITIWIGDNYQDSYIIALLILIPMVLSLVQTMGGVILQARNMQGFKTIVYASVAALNIVMSVIFVHWWGPIGCALATGISFTIGNIFILNIYYWKKVNIDIPRFWINIFSMSSPLLISLFLGFVLNKHYLANTWIFLILKIIAFSLLYVFLMWCLAMNKYEKSLFKVPAKNLFKKFFYIGRMGKIFK